MNAEPQSAVYEELASLRAEMEHLRYQVRELQRGGAGWWRKAAYLVGATLLAIMSFGAMTRVSGAQKEVAKPTTVLDAPVDVRGKSGKTIARFSEEKGHYGLEVFGPGDEVAAIGSNPKGGVILLSKGPNVNATMSAEGFRVWRAKNNVAYLGVEGEQGIVAVYNGTGKTVGFLLASTTTGGGNLTVADPSGNGVFSAGYTQDGGNACLSNKKRGLKCLGIGLP
jgi:hypothetical protein